LLLMLPSTTSKDSSETQDGTFVRESSSAKLGSGYEGLTILGSVPQNIQAVSVSS
jgi:hypothetical protein